MCAPGCRLLQAMYRRANQYGLRLAQVPEYTQADNLSIHSFLGLPFVQVHEPAVMPVLELALCRCLHFVASASQPTDWQATFPWMRNSSAEPFPVASGTAGQSSNLAMSIGGGSARLPVSPRAAALERKARRRDPQYLHTSGCVAVRVCPGRGFAWVTNRLRVSDLAHSLEDKVRESTELLRSFSDTVRVTEELFHAMSRILNRISGSKVRLVDQLRILWEVVKFHDARSAAGDEDE